MIVYLVTDGDYSDYSVECVCSTKEKAEEAKAFYNAQNDIEEYSVDELPEHPQGMFYYEVEMDREGNSRLGAVRVDGSCLENDRFWRYETEPEKITTAVFYVWARDKEHAVKIANERRTALLIADAWRVPKRDGFSRGVDIKYPEAKEVK